MVSARTWKSNGEAQRLALALAEKDVVFFVEEMVWTYDPRESPSLLPFVPYECQKDALRWLWDLEHRGKDGILEKSRDMGATWLTAAYAVHRWLFRPGAAIGFGSRKLELVDKLGDPKSIFDKIRTIIRNLPPWLLAAQAKGFDPKLHDNFCKIINPANGATITGEGGDDIGRGGRTTIYFVDEAAFLPRPLLVDQALSANARAKVFLSTPRGSNNPFAVKRLSGRYPVMTLHWKKDPRKTAWIIVPDTWEAKLDEEGELVLSDTDVIDFGLGTVPHPEKLPDGSRLVYPWMEEVLLKYDPVTVAQEYEIDYTASLEGVIVPARWLRACVGLVLTRSAQITAGFDVAAGGSAENVYLDRAGPVVEVIERWRGDDPTQAAFKVVGIAEKRRARRLLYDSVGVGSGVGGAIRLIRRPLPFSHHGVNTGTSPTSTVWPDGRQSKEIFQNLKAEAWWRLRVRAEKTFQFVTQGIYYPEDELLSLPPGPDTEALIAQLSNVRYFETETGKIIVEKKEQLRDRGVASPDLAEALVLSFCPVALGTTRRSKTGGTTKTTNQAQAQAQGLPHAPVKTGRRGKSA